MGAPNAQSKHTNALIQNKFITLNSCFDLNSFNVADLTKALKVSQNTLSITVLRFGS